jgi:hypothetical protein
MIKIYLIMVILFYKNDTIRSIGIGTISGDFIVRRITAILKVNHTVI